MNIAEFLRGEGIFEFALLPYSDVKVYDSGKEARAFDGFSPRSVVVFLIPYYVKGEKTSISRYAHSRDYHLYIKELTTRAERVLDKEFKCFADTSPICEADAACRSGLGCIGENGLVINQRYGSYIFIGEFFFSCDTEDTFFDGISKKSAPQKCIGCKACVRACPTGAINDKQVCISCINQKKRISDAEREIIKSSRLVWGCDICQEACPMNRGEETPISFFREERITSLDIKTLDELIETGEFPKRAYAWRGEAVIRRNIEIIDE